MTLPVYFWGDPAENLDRIRAERVSEEKREAKRKRKEQKNKARRIRALVKQAIKGK